jgi:Spy/CpxP family protein refolding chaperone
MKMTHITRSIVAAVLLSGSATVLLAQNAANSPCPFGHEPGYGRTLTPEQRAAHQAVVQQYLTELRQKQANGTMTAEEQAWLKQAQPDFRN